MQLRVRFSAATGGLFPIAPLRAAYVIITSRSGADHELRKGRTRPAIGRRTFLSIGASVLAAGASFIVLPRVDAASREAVDDPMRVPGALPQPSLLEASQGATIMEYGHHTNEEMRRCIQNCQDCHAICTEMIVHCLQLGGRHAAPDHIRLLADCAQICATSADYMLRVSSLHHRTCGLCSEVCRLCAEDCERLAGDDQMVKQCAEMCRRCAESCERMASKVAA